MPARRRVAAVAASLAVVALGGCSGEDGADLDGSDTAGATTTTAGASTTTVPALDVCGTVTDDDLAAAGVAAAFPGPGTPTVPPLAPEDLADPWAACDRAAADGSGAFLRVEVAGGASGTFERAVAQVSTAEEPEPVDGLGDDAAMGRIPGRYAGDVAARSLVVLVGGRVLRLTLPDEGGVDDVLVELGRAAVGRLRG